MLCASGAKAVDVALRAAVGSSRPKMEVVRILLDTGASPNATNLVGSNALHLAIRYGHLDVVKVLLEHRAVIDEFCYHTIKGSLWLLNKQAMEELLMKHSGQQQTAPLTECQP
jgi:ankyrin repeat protein